MNRQAEFELLNQSLKGIIAGLGHGSGMSRNGTLITLKEEIGAGEPVVSNELISDIRNRPDGCYVIVASKVVSLSESRIVRIPRHPLPPRRSPENLLKVLKKAGLSQDIEVSYRDAIGADLIEIDDETLTFALLPSNPNSSAYTLAQEIYRKSSKNVDVVITDTSSGWEKGNSIVQAPTFVASPIGSTAGCDIYYGQRLAALAEVMRNEVPRSPFVVVEPPTIRSLTREGIGCFKYEGFVDFNKEGKYLE